MCLGCMCSSGPYGQGGQVRGRVPTAEKGAGCCEEGRDRGGHKGGGGADNKEGGIPKDEKKR